MPLFTSDMPDARAFEAAARVLSGASRVGDSVATAEIFPREAYTGEDFWRFERWAVFGHEWLCLGHVNQVPEPGDHFAITVLEEPLIVSRDEQGHLHVLSAICQHRGHPLLDGLATPTERGVCQHGKLLVCPYHAWSYKLDGSLFAAPGMAKTVALGELRRRVRLPELRHEIVDGLIFVNFNADAAPLLPTLAKMRQMIEGYGLAELLPTSTSSVRIQSNWKLYQENSLEPYHTDTVHRTSHNPAPAHLSAFYDYAPGDGAIVTTTGFAASAELFAAGEHPVLPQIAGLSEVQQGRLLFIAVLPTLFMLCEPGSVLITLALPQGANEMTLQSFTLYPREAVNTSTFAAAAEAQAAALQVIIGEDILTQEALQRGHRSRFTPKGTLSWLEATIPQMNHWLLERYRDALAARPLPDAAHANRYRALDER